MAQFPGSIPVLTNPSSGDSLASPSHSGQHGAANDEIEALAAKFGSGASTPASGTVLTGTGTGVSAWQAPTSGLPAPGSVPVTVAIHGKVDGLGALLNASANSQTVMTLTAGQSLQDSDYLLVRDVRIDANSHTGITGVATTGSSSISLAHGILERIVVTNADTVGINLGNAQFLRTHDLKVTLGVGIGMLIANNATSGGANSQDHYGLQLTDKTVGLVINGTRSAGTPSWSNNFYNPQIIGNSVCGAALFRANATFYGGAPEFNSTGSATASVDGQTAKRSSMYLSDSMVRCVATNIGEATANPCFIIETGSVLTLVDVSGYGLTTGVLVKADATSAVVLEGIFAAMGAVQNVLGWPDGWQLPTAAQSVLYGKPIHTIDTTLPVLYSHVAPAFTGQGTHSPTMTYAEDADLGYARQAIFPAFAGSVNDNMAAIASITGVASRDTVISVVVKASADTQIGFNLHDGAAYNAFTNDEVYLKAGKPTRIVMGKRNIAGGSWSLFAYPIGTDAPTIQFANLQFYQGPTGTWATTQDIARIISTGAFNPGPLRATTTNLALQSAAVNTANKYPGKQVWNSTTSRVVFAADRAVSDVWKDGVNATVHTPV